MQLGVGGRGEVAQEWCILCLLWGVPFLELRFCRREPGATTEGWAGQGLEGRKKGAEDSKIPACW